MISQGSADMLPNLRGGAWDPHNHNSIAAISDSSLHLWDLRSMELILYLHIQRSPFYFSLVVKMYAVLFIFVSVLLTQKINCY